MGHLVDDRTWPVLRLVQLGPRGPDDVRGLTEGLAAAARRADAETRSFVVVLDYRDGTPATAEPVDTDGFWGVHGTALARWCAAMIRLDPDDGMTVLCRPMSAGERVAARCADVRGWAESWHEEDIHHGRRVDELIELRLGQVPVDLRVRLGEEPASKGSVGQRSRGRRKVQTEHMNDHPGFCS
jgi:hypothetical protein